MDPAQRAHRQSSGGEADEKIEEALPVRKFARAGDPRETARGPRSATIVLTLYLVQWVQRNGDLGRVGIKEVYTGAFRLVAPNAPMNNPTRCSNSKTAHLFDRFLVFQICFLPLISISNMDLLKMIDCKEE